MKRNVKNLEKKSATNMLTNLLSNTLTSKMNCERGNGKIGFKTLKLYDLFKGATSRVVANTNGSNRS